MDDREFLLALLRILTAPPSTLSCWAVLLQEALASGRAVVEAEEVGA